ncbi:MAG TPA: peptidoglycan-binding domain-containing protein [Candidatus Dormibacteraeota bacterium]|nr:peptidoglycan-binding domain-containing protein [Candidatus Dormibacteraeota bacterium]
MALRIRITLLSCLTLLAGAACATAASGATLAVPTSTALVQRQDIAQRQSVQGTITFADPDGIQALTIPPEVLTALPAPGTVVDRGQQLYRVGAQPVVLMLGSTPAWRRMAEGCSGADVKELEENLIALGFAGSGLSANGVFDQADVAAVRRWQASLGVPQDGTVSLGVIEFLPTPVRVTAVHAQLGALPPAGGGQSGGALLDVTSTKQVVTVDLDTAYLASVKAGNLVSVLLPDNRTQAQGTVSSVGSVATVAPAAQGGTPRPTVPVVIELANPGLVASYDQAPVRVSITTQVHHGVLVVPVVALVAQPNGSYAVRVRMGAGYRSLTVVPGIYSDGGLVEVSGQGLNAGDQVEVPQL